MVFYKIQLEHYLLIFGVIICGIAEKKHGQGMLKYTSFFLQSNHNLNLHLYFNEPQPIHAYKRYAYNKEYNYLLIIVYYLT